ncbi:MAG: hypothetical protein AABY22_12690, partial [Nanoarchaeota archaeon]
MAKIANHDAFVSTVMSLIEGYVAHNINKYELREQLKAITSCPTDKFVDWFLSECGFDTKKYYELNTQKLIYEIKAEGGDIGAVKAVEVTPDV